MRKSHFTHSAPQVVWYRLQRGQWKAGEPDQGVAGPTVLSVHKGEVFVQGQILHLNAKKKSVFLYCNYIWKCWPQTSKFMHAKSLSSSFLTDFSLLCCSLWRQLLTWSRPITRLPRPRKPTSFSFFWSSPPFVKWLWVNIEIFFSFKSRSLYHRVFICLSALQQYVMYFKKSIILFIQMKYFLQFINV